MYSGGSGSSVSLQKYNRSLLRKRKARKRTNLVDVKSKKNNLKTKEISELELNKIKRKIMLKVKRKQTRDRIITLINFALAILFLYLFYKYWTLTF